MYMVYFYPFDDGRMGVRMMKTTSQIGATVVSATFEVDCYVHFTGGHSVFVPAGGGIPVLRLPDGRELRAITDDMSHWDMSPTDEFMVAVFMTAEEEDE